MCSNLQFSSLPRWIESRAQHYLPLPSVGHAHCTALLHLCFEGSTHRCLVVVRYLSPLSPQLVLVTRASHYRSRTTFFKQITTQTYCHFNLWLMENQTQNSIDFKERNYPRPLPSSHESASILMGVHVFIVESLLSLANFRNCRSFFFLQNKDTLQRNLAMFIIDLNPILTRAHNVSHPWYHCTR